MMKINESDIFKMVESSIKKILKEQKDYDVLYRGVGAGQDQSSPVLWLSTSEEYCLNYGERILKYAVPMSVLDDLADTGQTMEYLIHDTDEYPFYEAQNFDLEKMKEHGFTGYYYHEDEYDCLNVCLFNKNDAKIL